MITNHRVDYSNDNNEETKRKFRQKRPQGNNGCTYDGVLITQRFSTGGHVPFMECPLTFPILAGDITPSAVMKKRSIFAIQ